MKQDDPDFLMLARGVCPNCGGGAFRPGPRGGLSQNIECRGCLRRFNVAVFRGELVFAQNIESKAEGGSSWDGRVYAMAGFPPARVHILRAGNPLCGFKRGFPKDWPPGHKWVGDDEAADATCPECKKQMLRGASNG